jgi:hypothetical protein
LGLHPGHFAADNLADYAVDGQAGTMMTSASSGNDEGEAQSTRIGTMRAMISSRTSAARRCKRTSGDASM